MDGSARPIDCRASAVVQGRSKGIYSTKTPPFPLAGLAAGRRSGLERRSISIVRTSSVVATYYSGTPADIDPSTCEANVEPGARRMCAHQRVGDGTSAYGRRAGQPGEKWQRLRGSRPR